MKPRWDKYFLYDEPCYRETILSISRYEDARSIHDLICFLKYKSDSRAEWIETEINRRDISEWFTFSYVLIGLGIRECRAGCSYYYDGTKWPKELFKNRRVRSIEERLKMSLKPICEQCLNTGWYHSVCFPPGTAGFTEGYAPALYDIAFPGETANETRERTRQWSMRSSANIFRNIYGVL